MAKLRQTFTDFAEMPEALRSFVFSSEFSNAQERITSSAPFTDEEKDLIGSKTMEALFNETSLSQAVADLKVAFVPSRLTEEGWKTFVTDYLRSLIWPLRDLFGDELAQMLAEQGIGTAGLPAFHVILKPLTYSGAASEIAAMVGFSLLGAQMRERLRDLIISRQKGVRTDPDVRDVLMRQADFGGLGLDANSADATIAGMNALLAGARILSEDEYADWLTEQARQEASPVRDATAPESAEDVEIREIKERMPAPAVNLQTQLEKSVEEIYAGLPTIPEDTYLQQRLRHTISSRLRDIRNNLELKQLLQRDVKVGGVGFDATTAESVARWIETGYQAAHASILEEEKHRLDEQLEEQKQKIVARRTREAKEHAEWYTEKILARKQEDVARSQLTEKFKRSFEPLPIDAKEQRAEKARFGELVSPPSPDVSPDVKVSKATAEFAAAQSASKPRLDDVAFAPQRLTGPIQELKSLTVPEFRRLGSTPDASVANILQKIELLGQESFELRAEGIKAWRESALARSYMKLVADAFASGKAVAVLAEEKRNGGEDVLSPAEIGAVISLNSQLHF